MGWFRLSKKYLIIGVVVIALILIGTAAYFLIAGGKQEKAESDSALEPALPVEPAELPSPAAPFKEKQVVSSPSSKTIPAPTPTIDPYATMSAYVSTKNGYLLRYTKDWTIKNTVSQDPRILEYLVFNPKTSTQAGELGITLSYTTRTYQEALALDPQTGEKIMVGTVSATKKTLRDSNNNVSINVIIPHKINTVIFFVKEKYQNIFNLMLSTFKFL